MTITTSKSTRTRPKRQGKSFKSDESPQDTPQELISLGCTLLRILIQWATSETAKRFSRRAELLSRAAWLPDSGCGDVRSIAAGLNIAEDGAAKLLRRIPNIPRSRPGQADLYRLEDIATAAGDSRKKGGQR